MPDFMNRMKRFFSFTALLWLSFALCSCGIAYKTEKTERSETSYYLEGLRGYHLGDYVYAEDCFSRLLKINPQHDAALYYMANITFSHGKHEEALRYMHAAAQADTSNYWYHLQIAQLYTINQQPSLAIQVYEDLLARYPKKSDLYYDLANLYLSQKDMDKALILIDEIEKFGGASEATGFYRFNTLMMQGKYKEAQPLLEALAQSSPSPRILTMLGDLYAETEKDTLALMCYNEAVAQDSGYIPAIFGQAEVYRFRQEYDAYFEKINLFMEDGYLDASLKMDYMEQLLQNRVFAVAFLKQIDTLYSKIYQHHQADTAVVYRYSGFLIQAGYDNRAAEVLRENVTRYPKDQDAWIQYLSINHFLQRWDTLYVAAREAMSLFPRQTDFMTMAGIAAWQTDKIPEAIAIFESVIPLAKNRDALLAQTWSILGDLYYAADESRKSFQAYEKSLKIDPEQSGVLNNYAYFLTLSGKNLQKAYEMSKKSVDAEPKNATYLDTFGWVLYTMGRYQEAKTIFRQVMMYGGDLSAEVLDHYAEVLYALKEFDVAFMYWEQARLKEKNPELEKKIEQRKTEMKR